MTNSNMTRMAYAAATLSALSACTAPQQQPMQPVPLAPPADYKGLAPAPVHTEMDPVALAQLKKAYNQITRPTNGHCAISVSTDRKARPVSAGVGANFEDTTQRINHALAALDPKATQVEIEFTAYKANGTVRINCAKNPSGFMCGDVVFAQLTQ